MKLNWIKQNAVALTFIAFLAAMLILFIALPKNDFSEKEKRYLAKAPELNGAKILSGTFSDDFEKYAADSFPFREDLFSLNSYYNYLSGRNGSNGIYLGRDGFLIETPVESSERFEENINRIARFCEKTGIPSYLCVAPSKGGVLTDYLPDFHYKYNDEEMLKRAEELSAGKLGYVDVYGVLSENAGRSYYKTDHHWTSFGAYLAYREICKQMELQYGSLDSYTVRKVENFYGTSYSKSGYWRNEADEIEIYVPKNINNVSLQTVSGSEIKNYDTMFFEDEFNSFDKYSGFLGGNHPLARIKTGGDGGKLVIIKDSYANCLAPFFTENFSEILLVDLRYYKKPLSQLLEDESPKAVLFTYGLSDLAESTDIVLY